MRQDASASDETRRRLGRILLAGTAVLAGALAWMGWRGLPFHAAAWEWGEYRVRPALIPPWQRPEGLVFHLNGPGGSVALEPASRQLRRRGYAVVEIDGPRWLEWAQDFQTTAITPCLDLSTALLWSAAALGPRLGLGGQPDTALLASGVAAPLARLAQSQANGRLGPALLVDASSAPTDITAPLCPTGDSDATVASIGLGELPQRLRTWPPRPQGSGEAGGDLALVDSSKVPTLAAGGQPELVLLISGDGGWARIDQELAHHLNAAGYPVLGVDALRTFWRRQEPQQLAGALTTVLETALERSGRGRVVLAGFACGADVLPFLWPHLPPSLQARTQAVVRLAPGLAARFRIDPRGWLGGQPGPGAPRVLPMARQLPAARVLCLSGSEEAHSLCRQPALPPWQLQTLPGNHHFDGDYSRLAAEIAAFIEHCSAEDADAHPAEPKLP